MPHKDSITWNAMLSSYSQLGLHTDALSLFHLMRYANTKPDHFTFTSTLNACSGLGSFRNGTKVHALIIAFGYQCYLPVNNSVIDMYGKCLDPCSARKAFEEMGESIRNEVTWCSLLFAYANSGQFNIAFETFYEMPKRVLVAWNIMITGFARYGEVEMCIQLLKEMRESLCCFPDEYGFQAYVYVGNGLVNMYAKCGDIKGSSYAFNEILEKDLVSWNAMLFGFGMHGLSTQALQIYDEMVAHGMKPDKVSFIGLLMTCSHAGLIHKGRLFFDIMSSLYGLTYEIDHVACMVDLLGRGGYLVEAKELSSKYSKKDTVEAKSSSYEALLGACSIHGDVRMGVSVWDDLQHSVDSQKDMGYVLLSNLYCASGQWKEAEIVRKAMVDQGVKKMPGYSWIEVKNKVTVFVAASLPEEIVISKDLKSDVDSRHLNGSC
ncbi:hypothetical protein Goari_020327, partial [Gossypium aridum]|nr:hypothetical protein [Gossypium aridum]